MELSGIATGALTWRRLRVLLAGLPPTSRLSRALDPASAWSVTDHLLAQVCDTVSLVADEVALGRWLYVAGNAKKGRRPKQPEPYPRLPRPGQQQEPPAARAPRPARPGPAAAARALAAARAGQVA